MSTIKVSDLQPTGFDLFSDFESFMQELNENELSEINGGLFTIPPSTVTRTITRTSCTITRTFPTRISPVIVDTVVNSGDA